MSHTWDVEVAPDKFEGVKAMKVRVEYGGALVFYDHMGLTVAYGAGQWLTVSEREV